MALLQKLTVNFNGRAYELTKIETFVSPTGSDPTGSKKNYMFITGVGGVGKSTLVNKFILNKLTGTDNSNMPFVHIDFDNPDFSVSDVFALLKEALGQLAIQNEQYAPRFNDIVKRISIEYSNTLNSNTSRGSDRQYFYQDLINDSDRKNLQFLKIPVFVVFDSFEELQFRASPSEIDVLFQFLNEIVQIAPTLKAIFIGRAEIINDRRPGENIVLNSFERGSAVSFLKTIGLTDEALCNSLFDKFDGNPLTLQLSANLVIREMGKMNAPNEEVEKRGIFDKIDRELIQQQLVARNLDHIHNKDLAAIAVPGILLRKINPDVIKNVLAEVCGLGEIDDEKASKLFEDLKKETFLLKQTDDKVEFRKDLRMSLYNLIIREKKYKAFRVHDAAVNYYKSRPDPSDQAEYLFHCLKKGDDISIIDKVYQPTMKAFMETALSELPVEARVQLTQLMGISADVENVGQVSNYRWELYMLAQISNVLEFGDEKQLIDTQLKLKVRTERTGNPEFTYFENLLNIRLLKYGKVLDSIAIAGTNSISSDDYAVNIPFDLLGVYVYEFRQDYKGASNIIGFLSRYPLWSPADSWLNNLPSTKENISLLIDFYCVKDRIAYRSGDKNNRPTEDNIRIAISAKLSTLPEIGTMSINELFALYPKVYIIPITQHYTINFPNANLSAKPGSGNINYRYILPKIMEQSLHKISNQNNYVNAADFSAKFEFLKNNIKTSADLERYTRRAYKVHLKDFCLPGTLDVSIFDFLLFVEALPRKTKQLELEKLTMASDFSGKRNQAAVDDFINVSEVKACLERLEKVFAIGGKRQLIVSDVLDEEGHQYVNLVQRSSGVHHISLLGYTYILEKMGIRFLKIAGTNTGTINAAILGVSGPKNEANSIKMLEHVIDLNYFSRVDGPPLLRTLLKTFGTKGNFLNMIFKMIFGLSVVIMALIWGVVILISTLPNLKLSTIFSNIPVLASILALIWLFIFCWTNFWNIVSRITTFGSGLNPGLFLYDWLKNIFKTYDILNVTELAAKTSQTPKLVIREGVDYNAELLKGDIVFICADVVTQNRILFPAMAKLFWQNPSSVEPAQFVRAAASAPFFFNSQVVKGIPIEDPVIKQAWIDAFGEYEPPSSACFVDGSMFSFFPISIFQNKGGDNAPLPTFGADTAASYEKINSKDISKLNWFVYFQRLLDTAKYNLEQDQVARGKVLEKAICRITVEKTNWLNYFLTDEEKLELFSLGAKAATEFLINFDGEDYKRSLGTQYALRL